jgi:alpha-D-ribose 1-methylphosphonate 5-triphosphate synthase subunit PhnH
MTTSASAIHPGFVDPVLDAQRTFRCVLDAFAKPAHPTSLNVALEYPGLPPAAICVLLCLVDIDTPVWLDPTLDASLGDYLRFHTGARTVVSPSDANFAVVASPDRLAPLSRFGQGTAISPELSTTVVVIVDGFDRGFAATLDGPGFERPRSLAPDGFTASTWQELSHNHRLFPVGVDILLASQSAVVGLPRSTRIDVPVPSVKVP